MKVLITCPPMLKQIEEFRPLFDEKGIELVIPNVVQTLTEDELIEIVPQVDGWIIGDDPATFKVFSAGKKGHLKAAIKWGVGTDNVDFKACEKLGIPVDNTPMMFGREVATLAVHYLIGLARHTFYIDREVRKGNWVKPTGISLMGKKVAIIGFGDIGKHTAQFLHGFGMEILVYDPFVKPTAEEKAMCTFYNWPEHIDQSDFVIVTCALNQSTFHLLDAEAFGRMKQGVSIINVSRGPVIDERALIDAIQAGKVGGAALDVFEHEPLPMDSPLRTFDNCILGTHNASNTIEAVRRASHEAIKKLFKMLEVN